MTDRVLEGQSRSIGITVTLPDGGTVTKARYVIGDAVDLTLAAPQVTWDEATAMLSIDVDLDGLELGRIYTEEAWVELGDGSKWPVWHDRWMLYPSSIAGDLGA